MQFELDCWVIRETLETLASLSGLQRQDVKLIVKVNPENYRFEQIISFAANQLQGSNVRGHHRLILQTDETRAFFHQTSLRRQIERLNAVGIGFILDHVGESDYSIDLIQNVCPNMIKLCTNLMSEFYVSESARKQLTDLLNVTDSKSIRVIAGTVEDAR